MSVIFALSGWHTHNSLSSEINKKLQKHDDKIFNGIRVGGYVPGVGIITGACNILFAWANDDVSTTGRVYLVVRGIFEILGLGSVFLILDMVVSVDRVCGRRIYLHSKYI